MCQLFAFVFLEEVSGSGDGGVRLALCAWYQFLKNALTAVGDGVGVAKGRKEGFFPVR